MKTKTCSKCKQTKPANKKTFTTRKGKLDSWCRECHCRSSRNYHKCHPGQGARYGATLVGCLRRRFNYMKARCGNPNTINYERYGARGIKVKFKNADEFVDYVINELQVDPRGLQIDRINNNGHYEKGNIRFVTAKVNSNNRRNSK